MLVHWPISSRGHGWGVLHLVDVPPDVTIVELDADLCRWWDGYYFFPSLRHWRIDPTHPLSTYSFVLANGDNSGLLRLKRSRFVLDVLTTRGEISRITDKELAQMVREAPEPHLRPGARVSVTTGDWAGLPAEVESVAGHRAIVRVSLFSVSTRLNYHLTDLQPA